MKRHFALILSTLLVLAACAPCPGAPAPAGGMAAMNRAAEAYVRLVLALGRHDPDYVDAYYGPPEWEKGGGSRQAPAPRDPHPRHGPACYPPGCSPASADEMARLRHSYLTRQLQALVSGWIC